jgi:hypothetical protein
MVIYALDENPQGAAKGLYTNKPQSDNLAYEDVYQPHIIDFDLTVRMEVEDEEVEGRWGKHGGTGSEVGEENGSALKCSAIRADQWACGRILRHFLKGGNRVRLTFVG